ncbi:MAG: hypothetical protein ABFD92_10980 [Planctomycetaceae bacterium]|nr:hypothetical protein [Planctomycetaceae bacterium]
MMNLRQRIFLVLQPHNGRGSNLVGFLVLGLIALNLLSVILESIAPVQQAYGPLFDAFEAVSVVLFTAEYLLRLWTCVEDPRYPNFRSYRFMQIIFGRFVQEWRCNGGILLPQRVFSLVLDPISPPNAM